MISILQFLHVEWLYITVCDCLSVLERLDKTILAEVLAYSCLLFNVFFIITSSSQKDCNCKTNDTFAPWDNFLSDQGRAVWCWQNGKNIKTFQTLKYSCIVLIINKSLLWCVTGHWSKLTKLAFCIIVSYFEQMFTKWNHVNTISAQLHVNQQIHFLTRNISKIVIVIMSTKQHCYFFGYWQSWVWQTCHTQTLFALFIAWRWRRA